MTHSLRPVQPADYHWLYAQNKSAYYDVVVRQFGEWDEAFQQSMFKDNFHLLAQGKIIVQAGLDIGLLVVIEQPEVIVLQEIQIQAAQRSRGLGTRLIQDLMNQARASNLALQLQVLFENHDAKHLYDRLGFQVIDRLENHFLMEYRDTPSNKY